MNYKEKFEQEVRDEVLRKQVLAEKERKSKAAVYTAFTLIAFLIYPAFGVFVILLLVGNEIYSLIKPKK